MTIIAQAQVRTRAEHWLGEVSSGTHHFLTDKPASFGGQDQGAAPYDFICSGLVSCTMITLRMYAQHKQIELGAFSVEADFHSNKEGREWIERRLSFQQPLSQELQQKVLEISAKTPVTKTLLRSLEIDTQLIASD